MVAPIKMLSIDDRMLTTDLDRAGYRNMGIHVKQATSFQDAQDMLERTTIDIIVINMDYEKVDALAVCQHFKSAEDSQEIPVVITSVQTSAGVKKKALGAGADLFVEQPLPRQFFIEKLKKLLDQKTRGDDRIDLQEPVHVKLNGETLELPIGDLSASGIFVASDLDVKEGDEVEMNFCIPGYVKPIHVHGAVVRKIFVEEGNTATSVKGVGIRFERFMGDSEKRLDRYVAKTADKDGKMIYYL